MHVGWMGIQNLSTKSMRRAFLLFSNHLKIYATCLSIIWKNNNKAHQNADVVDNVVDDNQAMDAHDRRKRLMELISENASISIAELALIMSVTKRTVDRDFAWLKERGYISREGNSKKGYWKVLKAIED